MAFSGLATKAYRGPIDMVWANTIQGNMEFIVGAYITFDQSAAAISARVAINISSVVDSGVSLYTLNFTTGFSTTNYASFIGGKDAGGADGTCLEMQTGLARFQSYSNVGGGEDHEYVSVLIM